MIKDLIDIQLTLLLIFKFSIYEQKDFYIVYGGSADGLVSTLTDPTLTTVEQHGDKMGEIATDLLLRRINSEDELIPTTTKVIKTNLIARGSTRR